MIRRMAVCITAGMVAGGRVGADTPQELDRARAAEGARRRPCDKGIEGV